MATVTMPQLGESVTEGTILKWLKQPGEPVALDDSLCEIETEKVTAELPSPYEGTMGAHLVPEGEAIEVGETLCEIVESSAAAGTVSPRAPQPSAQPASTAVGGWSGGPMAIPPDEVATPTGNGAVSIPDATAKPVPASAAVARKPDSRERFYSPAVMRLAAEHSIDLASITGRGVGGRVTRKDVEAALAGATTSRPSPATGRPPVEAPSGAPYTVVALSPTRRTIAENLKRSNLEAPQAWTMVEVDVTGLVRRRESEKENFARQEGVDLTLLPYFTAAVCETLRAYPSLNARWDGDELRMYRAQNIGIAIATESGLVVPVVHNAGDLGVAGLAKQIADLVQRAHNRKLRIEDIEGGTFTVNNTGVFGSIVSKPIVNHPQVAIVTMERVVKRPVVIEGDAIAVRSMMNVCLSFDHRAMDGLEAGNFLAALRLRLQAIS